MKQLFITGTYRSGSTLLEKLFSHHPMFCIASQPLPLLFVHAKEEFYKAKEITGLLPLDTMFPQQQYHPYELYSFLDQHKIEKEDLSIVLARLKSYTGWLTPQVGRLFNEITPGNFYQVYTQLLEKLPGLFALHKANYVGSKEIVCEEFVPYLLKKGSRVLVIIRDPRDVITSLAYGEGRKFTGLVRPLLFSIRVWRKSVAFSIAMQNDPNFLFLKYEDLVRSPAETLRRITDYLDVLAFSSEIVELDFRDRNSKPWEGNSSFEKFSRISDSPVGRFRNFLSDDVIRFIESVCFPEMKYLGYQLSAPRSEFNIERILKNQSAFDVLRFEFKNVYGSLRSRLEEEEERLRLLSVGELCYGEKTRWFIFERVFNELFKVMTDAEP